MNTPKSYNDMLNKIGIMTMIMLLICWYMVVLSFPWIKESIDIFIVDKLNINEVIEIPLIKIKVNCNYIIPIVLAGLARVFRLHDKISNILKLRLNYDINVVLKPLALGVGYEIKSVEAVKTKRKILMDRTFYEYVSYNNPVIDRHIIDRTLDELCWYWISVEWIFIQVISLIICAFSINIITISILVFISIITAIICKIKKNSCINNSKIEVNKILGDEDRKFKILREFTNALQN